MSLHLDTPTLRRSTAKELVPLFLSLIHEYTEPEVSTQLLSAVKSGSVPAWTLSVWLTVAKDPVTLVAAVKQDYSACGRRIGLKRIGKLFKIGQWRRAWHCLGGKDGLLELLAYLSVKSARALITAIVRNVGSEANRELQETFSDLLGSLYPSVDVESVTKTTDERPLHRIHALLLPACTPELVRQVIVIKSHPLHRYVPFERLLRTHYGLLRDVVLEIIFKKSDLDVDNTRFLPALLHWCPDHPADESHFTEPMLFSLSLLRGLAKHTDSEMPASTFSETLLLPLLQRAWNKKVAWADLKEIIELAIKYLENHSTACDYLSTRRSGHWLGFEHQIARLWSMRPHIFEDTLISTLRLLRRPSRDVDAQNISCVDRPLRYQLLSLRLLHAEDIKIDSIEKQDVERLCRKSWPCNVFTELQRDHAISLFRQLLRKYPETNFMQKGSGIFLHSPTPGAFYEQVFLHSPTPGAFYGDTSLMMIYLEKGQEGALERATNYVESTRKKSAESRDQTARAHYANSALFAAIASGSLQLYGETLTWARRFTRDALTVKSLYSAAALNTDQGIELLSGIPANLSQMTTSALRLNIAKANGILLSLLETACGAISEPSFQASDWRPLLYVFSLVVTRRLSCARRLLKSLNLKEEDIYGILWSETLEMLLRAERIGLDPDHEPLGFNTIKGPIGGDGAHKIPVAQLLGSSYTFLDNLARARDSLWHELRPLSHPLTAELLAPWPRGLPIQSFCAQNNICTPAALGNMPFVASLACKIVLTTPEIAETLVPEDEETKNAIGPFVDDFKTALQIYILQSMPQEQAKRKEIAWEHTINALSPSRMSRDEAYRILESEDFFGFGVPKKYQKQIIQDYPILPDSFDINESIEWDPSAHEPVTEAARHLSPTWLDCSFETRHGNYSRHKTMRDPMVIPNPHTVPYKPREFWSLGKFSAPQSAPASIREGLIISALLVLDAQKGGSSRLLIKPFPSEADRRYPSVFLDAEFLMRQERTSDSVHRLLRTLIKEVPPLLLAELADSALEAINSHETSSPKAAIAWNLLRLVAASDRPQLGASLAVRAILDQPDASSWHRAILTRKLLRNLDADQARDTLLSFADGVVEKMAKQAAYASSDKADGDTQKLLIKITTIKFLAQLLNDADFVSIRTNIEILLKLYQESRHIDVRVAVLESLLNMLEQYTRETSTPDEDRVLSALEVIIPLASGLDERKPMQEKDWVEAEHILEVPHVGEGEWGGLPPILGVLAQRIQFSETPTHIRQHLIAHIILPIIKRSRAVNARWIRIFATKHQLTLNMEDLIIMPVCPEILEQLLRYGFTNTPRSILRLYQEFVHAKMLPSAEVSAVNKKVTEDKSLRESNEGRHWLSLYGLKYNSLSSSLAGRLSYVWEESVISEGITVSQVQSFALGHAKTLLSISDVSFEHWKTFMKSLEPPNDPSRSDEDRQAWAENCKPVLEAILTGVDSIRTLEWQRDPKRQPPFLPSIFENRLGLLSYPCSNTSMSAADGYKVFAAELASLINQIVERGTTYHEEYQQLTTAALQPASTARGWVAFYLGIRTIASLTETMAVLLRVELAAVLLESLGEEPDEELFSSIKRLLTSWIASDVETIRMKAFKVDVTLSKKWRKALL